MIPETPNTVSSTAVSTPTATRTILIVDDDPSVTETFERMLRLEGYQVVTALSAEAGLNQAERSHPHAIILDLRMPLVDGLSVPSHASVRNKTSPGCPSPSSRATTSWMMQSLAGCAA
jgi:CheY-like chemotaxis protein